MDRIFPVWMEYLGILIRYLFLCVPGVILIKVLRRFIHPTRRIEVITLATMRALLLAPVPLSERLITIYPFSIAVLQYISGDGTTATTSTFVLPLAITFFVSIASSRAKAEFEWMQGGKPPAP